MSGTNLGSRKTPSMDTVQISTRPAHCDSQSTSWLQNLSRGTEEQPPNAVLLAGIKKFKTYLPNVGNLPCGDGWMNKPINMVTLGKVYYIYYWVYHSTNEQTQASPAFVANAAGGMKSAKADPRSPCQNHPSCVSLFTGTTSDNPWSPTNNKWLLL